MRRESKTASSSFQSQAIGFKVQGPGVGTQATPPVPKFSQFVQKHLKKETRLSQLAARLIFYSIFNLILLGR